MKNPSSKAKIILSIVFIYCLVCSFQFAMAQNVGINTSGATPHTSTILDLNTGNTFNSPNGKGFLPPNVALTGRSDITTISSPAVSLLVYNTASANTGSLAVSPGYYYFNGSMWVAFSGNGSNNWALLGNDATTSTLNFLGTTDNQDLVFRTNNTEQMRLYGIGTFGNSVVNTVGSDGQGSNAKTFSWQSPNSGYAGLIFNSGAASNQNGLAVKVAGTSSLQTILDLSTGTQSITGTPVMSVRANGNVGIGTTTPANKLSIVATVTNTGFQLQDGSQGANKVLTSDATGRASWQNSSSSLLPTIYEFTSNFTITNPGTAFITTTVGPVFNWVAPATGRVLITFNKIAPYFFTCTNGHAGFGFTVNGSGSNISLITNVFRFATSGGEVVFAPAEEAFNVIAGNTYAIQAYYATQSMTSCMFNFRGNSSGSERFLIQYIN